MNVKNPYLSRGTFPCQVIKQRWLIDLQAVCNGSKKLNFSKVMTHRFSRDRVILKFALILGDSTNVSTAAACCFCGAWCVGFAKQDRCCLVTRALSRHPPRSWLQYPLHRFSSPFFLLFSDHPALSSFAVACDEWSGRDGRGAVGCGCAISALSVFFIAQHRFDLFFLNWKKGIIIRVFSRV